MARTNLSLGNLYRAISGSVRTSQTVSLGGLGGVSAGSNAAFTSFAIDSVTTNLPLYTYVVESTAESASFTFGTQGSLHVTKVSPQANNFTCSFTNANFTIGTPTYGATANFPYTAAAVGTTTYAEAQSGISMSYADGYNINATGYGTVSTKVLYAVDVYNTINQPDFCLLFGTKVTLADNTEINIEDLNVGDIIKAWAPIGLPDETLDATDTGATEWRFYQTENNSGDYTEVTVRNLTFNFASSYYSINNGFLKATETHPLWVWDNEIQKYHFKIVETLKNGDRLIHFDETTGLREIEITNIEVIVGDVEIVIVDVENVDVFLANGIISHNKGSNVSSIPATGLKMYIEPAKSGSFASNSYPATGTPTVDILDLTGNGTGLRPGLQAPLSLASGNPSYNQGATRKERYYAYNGTSNLFYKDITSNINGGITNFNTNTGTIHVWVRPTTTLGTTTRHIFDYAGFYGLAIESSNSSTLDRVKFYGSTLGNSAQLTTSLSANVWYMISATFQPSGTVTVYVDGTSVGTFTAAAFSAPASTNYVTIGSNSARTTFWNGQIGPVLFYNTLQAAGDVTRTYNYFSPNYK
jgi:hypothetical protein